MQADHLDRLAAALSGHDGVAALDRLLRVTLEILPVMGAAVAVIGQGQHLGRLAVAGPVEAIDDLQFDLGEGPCIAADHTGTPVLEPDLALAGGDWPGFAPAAVELGAAAVFAFPLRLGAVHVGVLSLYAPTPGPLSTGDLADGVAVARVATHLLLDIQHAVPSGALPLRLVEVLDDRSQVHQATGMIAAQIGADVAGALGRLRAFAWSNDRTVDDVAADVIARGLRFDGTA